MATTAPPASAPRIVRLFALVALGVVLAAGRTSPETAPESAPQSGAEPRFLSGQLLVAAPEMPDPRFAETVIVIVSHDADGAMGLIVNRVLGSGPIALLLDALDVEAEVAPDLPDGGQVRLLTGGPVEPHRGFVLHSDDFAGASTRPVGDGIAVSFGTDALAAMAGGHGPRQGVVVLGYAGWGPGQLESELARDDWLVVPALSSLVFAEDPETVWQRARDTYGIEL